MIWEIKFVTDVLDLFLLAESIGCRTLVFDTFEVSAWLKGECNPLASPVFACFLCL